MVIGLSLPELLVEDEKPLVIVKVNGIVVESGDRVTLEKNSITLDATDSLNPDGKIKFWGIVLYDHGTNEVSCNRCIGGGELISKAKIVVSLPKGQYDLVIVLRGDGGLFGRGSEKDVAGLSPPVVISLI